MGDQGSFSVTAGPLDSMWLYFLGVVRPISPLMAPLPPPHEIDGKALLLLRSDVMMKYMGLKLGPALKLSYHIDRLKQGKF